MTITTPSEAVLHFGRMATYGEISGIIIMVGEYVVMLSINNFKTTHIPYPFEVEEWPDAHNRQI